MESAPGESRVAATPDTVKKFISLGCTVAVERGAGLAAGFVDGAFNTIGAELVDPGDPQAWSQAEVVLCVQSPSAGALAGMRSGALLVGLLAPYANSSLAATLELAGLSAMALELLP
ncbi:MAG: NAD(P)(+) transhydrogenase (Re/Si-specific) subunit alpha, partial [Prochlorococcus sp.]